MRVFTVFREEALAISALAGFPAILVELEFGEVGFCEKTGETGENLLRKARTSNTLNPHTVSGRNRTRATLERGEHTFRCAISAPLVCYVVNLSRNNKERQQVDRPYVAKTAAKKPEILENFLSFVLLCYLSDGDPK